MIPDTIVSTETSHGSSAHIRNDQKKHNGVKKNHEHTVYEAQRSMSDFMKSANKLTYRTPAETECFSFASSSFAIVTSFVTYQPVSQKRAITEVKQETVNRICMSVSVK